MSLAVKFPALMTVDEFLKWPGDGTGTRYELVDGELRAQDPASDAHGTIQTNLTMAIGQHLDKARPNCRLVINPGVAPRLRTKWNYREPELGVTCKPNRADEHMLPDPILLIEILSPSNYRKTWSNIPLYATLPSLQEILIVDSVEVAGEILRRGVDGSWPQASEPIEKDGIVRLASIGLEFPLSVAYRNTYLAQGGEV